MRSLLQGSLDQECQHKQTRGLPCCPCSMSRTIGSAVKLLRVLNRQAEQIMTDLSIHIGTGLVVQDSTDENVHVGGDKWFVEICSPGVG